MKNPFLLRNRFLPYAVIFVCTMFCAFSCAKRLSIEQTKSVANRYITDGKYKEALKLLFDNLTDEQIAQNALPILAKSVMQIETLFDDAVERARSIPGVEITSARLCDDKKFLVIADGQNKKILVLTYPDMEEAMRIDTQAPVYTAVMDHSGNRLATAGHDGYVYFYEYPSGKEIKKIQAHEYPVRDLWLTKDGKLVTVSNDHTIRVYDPETDELLQSMKIHSMNIKNVVFAPDEKFLATAANDGSVQTLEYDNGKLSLIGSYINVTRNYVNAIAVSPDKKVVASGSGDGYVRLWGATDHNLLGEISLDTPIAALSFSPDGKKIIAGAEKQVALINAVTKEAIIIFPTTYDVFHSAEFVDENHVMVADTYSIRHIRIPSTDEILKLGHEIYNNL